MREKKIPARDDFDAAIDKVIAYTNKTLGIGVVSRLSDPGAYPEITHLVPTGLPTLDDVFGVGGLPLGKLTEISGPESSGKTTLTKYLAMKCQEMQVMPAIFDTEQSGVLEFDRGLGVDLTRAAGDQPDTLEEVFEHISVTVEGMEAAGVPGCCFFDSVAATPLAAELKIGFDEEGRFAQRASYLSNHLPKLVKGLKSGRVGLVFVNQVREKIGATAFQKKTYSPGGRALRHWAHVRLELTPMGREGGSQIIVAGKVVGIKTRVKAIKNKLAAPFRETFLEIRFDPPRIVEETPKSGKKAPLFTPARVTRTPV